MTFAVCTCADELPSVAWRLITGGWIIVRTAQQLSIVYSTALLADPGYICLSMSSQLLAAKSTCRPSTTFRLAGTSKCYWLITMRSLCVDQQRKNGSSSSWMSWFSAVCIWQLRSSSLTNFTGSRLMLRPVGVSALPRYHRLSFAAPAFQPSATELFRSLLPGCGTPCCRTSRRRRHCLFLWNAWRLISSVFRSPHFCNRPTLEVTSSLSQ